MCEYIIQQSVFYFVQHADEILLILQTILDKYVVRVRQLVLMCLSSFDNYIFYELKISICLKVLFTNLYSNLIACECIKRCLCKMITEYFCVFKQSRIFDRFLGRLASLHVNNKRFQQDKENFKKLRKNKKYSRMSGPYILSQSMTVV